MIFHNHHCFYRRHLAAAVVSSVHPGSVILIAVVSNPEVSNMYRFSSAALLEALELVMFNNRMRFGDIIVKQISWIAMGMSPVPTIANLLCGNL
jgi:hypothetical protein